jgi:hypothetical protein
MRLRAHAFRSRVTRLSITGEETAVVQLDDETRAAIEERLAQAERGEFAPGEIVAEADKRQGV